MYQTVKLTNQIKLNDLQKKVISDVAYDLNLIKTKVNFLDDIVVRAGFVADTLFNVEPHDIDAYYTTKEQIGVKFQKCRCDEIRNLIKDCNFKLMNTKYELDLGHSGEGELYIPPVAKMTGFFSHLWEVANMVCIDSNADVWGNKEAFDCITNRIHEIRFDGWLYYPYFIREFPHVDYYYYYANNCLRGLRTIFIKKYTGIGPNYKMLLENAKLILDYVVTVPEYKEEYRNYHKKKMYNMSLDDLKLALKVTKVNNQDYLLEKFAEILFND
ncbi:hypothetical protein HYV31_02435 [candidate division WWE3 bacterium]|nr:hypothetical protein [candidate division WWE3 bacterium]